MISKKTWCFGVVILTGLLLISIGSITVVIDPYFHYHVPLSELEYPISNERYQNDGIVKHFRYDAIITGTSMTQNFKTSELDQYFGTKSIKVPFAGASYKEVNDNLKNAVDANSDIRIILRGLDHDSLSNNKDSMRYETAYYPWYLYDDFILNDVNYVLNKSVIFDCTLGVIEYTQAGGMTTTFDEYSNWSTGRVFGKDAVDAGYKRAEKAVTEKEFSLQDLTRLEENLYQNVTELAEANPQIDFYLFFPPYSIYYWDNQKQEGTLNWQLELELAAIEILLEYHNIYLFSFFDEFDMICDLDNYKDYVHYGEWINSQIIEWMYQGEHQLTKDNYQQYYEKIYRFYTEYDYDALFQ